MSISISKEVKWLLIGLAMVLLGWLGLAAFGTAFSFGAALSVFLSIVGGITSLFMFVNLVSSEFDEARAKEKADLVQYRDCYHKAMYDLDKALSEVDALKEEAK